MVILDMLACKTKFTVDLMVHLAIRGSLHHTCSFYIELIVFHDLEILLLCTCECCFNIVPKTNQSRSTTLNMGDCTSNHTYT